VAKRGGVGGVLLEGRRRRAARKGGGRVRLNREKRDCVKPIIFSGEL